MKKLRLSFLIILFLLINLSLFAKSEIGTAAPDFTLTDLNDKEHTLSSYKGNIVILFFAGWS